MRHLILLFIIVTLSVGCANSLYDIKSIEHDKLLKHKVDHNSFELGWLPESIEKQALFRDYRVIDAEITLDPNIDTTSIFHKSNQQKKVGLSIVSHVLNIDSQNGLIEMKGEIIGDWKNTEPHEFEIYIGHRKDTVANVTFMFSEHIDNFYKGKKVDKNIDFKVPAFLLSNSKRFYVVPHIASNKNGKNKEMKFDIKSKIDKRSILIFSLPNRYAEIFEIGKLLEK